MSENLLGRRVKARIGHRLPGCLTEFGILGTIVKVTTFNVSISWDDKLGRYLSYMLPEVTRLYDLIEESDEVDEWANEYEVSL